jgi:hypothetical protein
VDLSKKKELLVKKELKLYKVKLSKLILYDNLYSMPRENLLRYFLYGFTNYVKILNEAVKEELPLS